MHRPQKEDAQFKINSLLVKIGATLEVIIAVALVLAIVISLIPVFSSVIGLFGNDGGLDAFSTILNQLFTLIIGIEFLKMICRYNVDSVIEVILFALARQLVVTHSTPLENLLTIIGICLLFFIRKYLFIKQVDEVGNEHRRDTTTKLEDEADRKKEE